MLQAAGEGSCMACQALQFQLGKLEEQLASARSNASAATAAQMDLSEREATLVQELQMALDIRDSLQTQLGNLSQDLHTTSQQRDLVCEQLCQLQARSGAASCDAGSSGVFLQNTTQDVAAPDQGLVHATVAHQAPEFVKSCDEQARSRALHELQSLSAKAQKEADRLQRELEASEACVASLKADVARADSAASEATLQRNQAREAAVRAECDLASAQVRLSALQQQEDEGEALKRRFADSKKRVQVLLHCNMHDTGCKKHPYL